MIDSEAEKLRRMYQHYGYRCFVCDYRATQRAHIIGDTQPNMKRYGLKVINNILNWLPVCETRCNSLVDISNNPIERDLIAGLILTNEDTEETRKMIEEIVKDNILRKVAKNEKSGAL